MSAKYTLVYCMRRKPVISACCLCDLTFTSTFFPVQSSTEKFVEHCARKLVTSKVKCQKRLETSSNLKTKEIYYIRRTSWTILDGYVMPLGCQLALWIICIVFGFLDLWNKVTNISHWLLLLHSPHHPAFVPEAQVAESGSCGLLLVRDSDQRAGWPQLGPEDHLQGLGGGQGVVLMKTIV